MKNYSPQIEIYPNNSFNLQPDLTQKPWFRSYRFVIFSIVFLVSAAISLTYNYSRPAIYRSSATLLTSAMTAIDSESTTADVQHVAIQKQILLGHELVAETLRRLKAATASDAVLKLAPKDIQNFLNVEPVTETNLVEIRAEGTDPEFLPLLVNTWIDVYQDARSEDIKKLTGNTTRLIEDELDGLAEKMNAKRTELEDFRKINDISSSGRDENEPLARLNGLNDSLNKASEDEIKAKANLDAIKSAIARDQAVVPDQERGSLQDLEKRLQDLREQLTDFDKKFTRDYMAKQHKYNPIPEQIKKLEAEIKNKRDYGKNVVITEAENNYVAAQQTVKEVRAQLDEQKKQASAFSTKFAEHDALKTDMEGLEQLYRETQERLVKIQTSQKEKYPQVTVISRAYLSMDPVRPNYSRDALIALVSSLLLGLFTVWIFEYLTRKQEQPSGITLSGIHLYNPTITDRLNYQQTAARPIEQRQNNALASPLHRELSAQQLKVLLDASNLKGKQVISLLLSGLTLDEAATLKADQIDPETATITITGSAPRTLNFNGALKLLFAQSGGHPVWDTDKSASSDDLAAVLLCAAVDSGLPNPGEITAEAIRHSYIAYLVRQGLRLSDLEQITGYLEPSVISSYSSYSPPQQGLNIEDVDLFYPALDNIT
ncbi:MAG: integrase [Methylococcaceae bacterium]|nr:integrase [Methylococcaceae bacterium]